MEISAILQQFPYLGLFALLILGGIGFPFPEDTTLILCGFLIVSGVVRPLPALIVVYIGVLITDLFLYFVGKKYGRMVLTHKRFQKILSRERLSYLEKKFNKWGLLVVMFGRHLIGLRAQVILAAGVMRMPFLKFVITDAVSSSFTVAFMVGVGYLGGNSLQVLRKDITRVEHVAIFLGVALLALFFVFRYLRSRRKAPR